MLSAGLCPVPLEAAWFYSAVPHARRCPPSFLGFCRCTASELSSCGSRDQAQKVGRRIRRQQSFGKFAAATVSGSCRRRVDHFCSHLNVEPTAVPAESPWCWNGVWRCSSQPLSCFTIAWNWSNADVDVGVWNASAAAPVDALSSRQWRRSSTCKQCFHRHAWSSSV